MNKMILSQAQRATKGKRVHLGAVSGKEWAEFMTYLAFYRRMGV